jgi:hypothetical protein
MDNSPAEHTEQSPEVAERELLRWRSVPARRKMGRTMWVTVLILGLPVVLVVWYGPFYGLLGLLILGGSLLSFFLPTDFVLTDRAVLRRYLGVDQKRAWTEFRSFYPDNNGVLLSPFPQPSRLENFRGMYLRFEGNRDEVLTVVADRIAGTATGETV